MAGTGGKREGAGRKPKADEENSKKIILAALKSLYSIYDDDEAKSKFIKDELLGTQRGNQFIAEHIFGKPKETIDNNVTINDFKIADVLNFKK